MCDSAEFLICFSRGLRFHGGFGNFPKNSTCNERARKKNAKNFVIWPSNEIETPFGAGMFAIFRRIAGNTAPKLNSSTKIPSGKKTKKNAE